MPKNIFQRPQPVARTQNVPRHGAPLPVRKIETKRVPHPKDVAPTVPTLEALLGKRF